MATDDDNQDDDQNKGGDDDQNKGGNDDQNKGGDDDQNKGGNDDGKKADEPTGWEAERIALAGEDEKFLTHLSRYGTKDEALKAGHSAATKLGEKVTTIGKPGEKATEGELVDYRKDQGIPEKAEDYDLELGKGVVLGEMDAMAVSKFKEIAHKLNLSPGEVSAITKHQLAVQDQVIEDLANHDAQLEVDCEAELSREAIWGKEMNRNLNMVNNLLDTAPEGVKDLLWSARLSDGSPLGSNPIVLRALNTWARQINPLGTIVPNTGQTSLDTVSSEIEEIEGKMGTPAYDKSEKMQSRYRDLLDMRTKHDALNKKAK